MDPYRVIIADDHALFRQGLRILIDQVPGLEVVGEAENGVSLIRLLSEVTADIILLDITMPSLRGIEAIPKIKMLHPPKSTASSYPGPLGSVKRRCRTKTTPKQVSGRDPQVGFVTQALSDALLGGNFG
jgi:CheY-like chemotaxis protein